MTGDNLFQMLHEQTDWHTDTMKPCGLRVVR